MTFSEYCLNELGYQTITTFWDDFAIADRFGLSAVLDTFKRAFREWKSNVKYLAELVLVLNHRLWMHYNAGRKNLASVYNKIWQAADAWCNENLTGDDAAYYYKITD